MPVNGESTGVVITNRDIYDKVEGLEKAMAKVAHQAAVLVDHEGRLRSVERWKYAFPASLGTSILSVVLAVILGGLHG